jgi:O-methyltransferase involved in polyketide biosynthesis
MPGETIHLTREKETLLITLQGKALESRRPDSRLRDRFADAAVEKIDYDFARLKVDANMASGLAIRAVKFDNWTRAFLAAHPDAVVLHLGCGLDTRVQRIDPPPSTEWFDVDYPDVIELRRKLYPARAHYHLVGSSVTDLAWLETIPRDRPAMIVAEGLTPYLDPEAGRRLVAALVAHFPQGELACDAYSDLGLKFVRNSPACKATGAELTWAIEDPRELEKAAPGLRLVEERSAYDAGDAAHMSLGARLFIVVWRFIPALRKVGRMLRFRF